MGGAIQYVYRDGSRLTPWMLYCVNRFSEAMYSAFGERILVTSGIRTYEEQKRIFLMRYVRHGDIRGRKVYDTRWWNGYLWYRIDPVGTVRQPRLSNHEIQGTTAAVDLRDTGKDAGISKFNNPRSNWARANAWRYGLSPEGYNFKEPWHFSIADIFRTPPATPAGGNSRPIPDTKEWDEMASKQEIKDALFEVLTQVDLGPGKRNHYDSLKFIADLAARSGATASEIAQAVASFPVPAQDENGHLIRDDSGNPVTYQLQGYLASTSARVGGQPAEVDTDALAKSLAPLITANLSALSDEDVARIASASADEQARRLGK